MDASVKLLKLRQWIHNNGYYYLSRDIDLSISIFILKITFEFPQKSEILSGFGLNCQIGTPKNQDKNSQLNWPSGLACNGWLTAPIISIKRCLSKFPNSMQVEESIFKNQEESWNSMVNPVDMMVARQWQRLKDGEGWRDLVYVAMKKKGNK